jgi:glycosyltransferase involved in cell wall biosynthesis
VKILHIIPRWIGGGPERHIIELARQNLLAGAYVSHRVLVLDRPISAPLLLSARKHGVHVINGSWKDVLTSEVEDADIVNVTYWNHPLFQEFLENPLPPARVMVRSAVAGHTVPQVLFSELTSYPDLWELSAPRGYGAKHIEAEHPWVEYIPALADLERLEGFRRKRHSGMRAAYLGSLTPAKLHPSLPEILAQLDRNIGIDLIGDADVDSLTALRRQLGARGLLDRIVFHGHLENIAQALSVADIFIYPLTPSTSATSEKALQEAMWLGLPPVLMAGSAATGWLRPGDTGFVASDTAEFAHHVNLLARDDALRSKVGRAAKKFARSQFDTRKNAQSFVDLGIRLTSLPKRFHTCLPAVVGSGADRFLRSIGFDRPSFIDRVMAAKDFSRESNFMLLNSEGGVAHYRKHHPDDSELRDWSLELVSAIEFSRDS